MELIIVRKNKTIMVYENILNKLISIKICEIKNELKKYSIEQLKELIIYIENNVEVNSSKIDLIYQIIDEDFLN